MKTNDQYESIGAYLDGELTADEQERVERMLAEDGAARRVHDELRALSGTLQAMPHIGVGRDLSDSILRRAERAMLASAPAADADGGDVHQRSADRNGRAPAALQVPIGRSLRSLVWAGAAVAAALVILVVNHREQDDRQPVVARNESARAPAEGIASAPASSDKDQPGKALKSFHHDDMTMGKDAAPGVVSKAFARDASGDKQEDVAEGQSAAADQPFSAIAAAGAATGGGGGGAFGGLAAGGQGESQIGGGGGYASTDDLLIVHVDVANEAAAREKFGLLLAQNKIAWRDDTDRQRTGSGSDRLPGRREVDTRLADRATEAAPDAPPLAGGPAPGAPAEQYPFDEGVETEQNRAENGRFNEETAQDIAPVEVVYVEASPEQIEATLTALVDRPAEFTAVAMDVPASGARWEFREQLGQQRGADIAARGSLLRKSQATLRAEIDELVASIRGKTSAGSAGRLAQSAKPRYSEQSNAERPAAPPTGGSQPFDTAQSGANDAPAGRELAKGAEASKQGQDAEDADDAPRDAGDGQPLDGADDALINPAAPPRKADTPTVDAVTTPQPLAEDGRDKSESVAEKLDSYGFAQRLPSAKAKRFARNPGRPAADSDHRATAQPDDALAEKKANVDSSSAKLQPSVALPKPGDAADAAGAAAEPAVPSRPPPSPAPTGEPHAAKSDPVALKPKAPAEQPQLTERAGVAQQAESLELQVQTASPRTAPLRVLFVFHGPPQNVAKTRAAEVEANESATPAAPAESSPGDAKQ
jgi:hypothetical protein